MREKIACAQFIVGLVDGKIKRTLQLEGVISLEVAIERAKTIKIIQENSFSGRKNFERAESKGKFYKEFQRKERKF